MTVDRSNLFEPSVLHVSPDFPSTQVVLPAEVDVTDLTILLDKYMQGFLAAARADFQKSFKVNQLEKHAPRIAHRKQSGPHCGLETSHRALSALGLNLLADEVIALGKELGIDMSSTIIEQLKMIKKLAENALPSESIKFGLLDFDFGFYLADELDAHFNTVLTEYASRATAEEALHQKAQKMVALLEQNHVFIVTVGQNKGDNIHNYWGTSELQMEESNHWPKPSHSLAITGYSIAGNQLYFDVYDPAISMAPLRVGGRHLVEHIGTAAIDLCIQRSIF